MHSVRRVSSVLLSFASVATLGVAVPAGAQTPPQLVPYTARLIAGSGTAAIAKGAKCPVSGNTSLDAYGDGCLATEVQLGTTTGGPRFAVPDKNGNIFIADFVNGLVRRVDAVTGIITAVAGGAASSPATGTACGAAISLSSDGDGCLGTAVKLSKPAGLAFDASGNLFFADNGFDNIREIAATGGFITTTGIITHIAGNTTFGYSTNNGSTTGPVPAATAYLNFPYGIAFDSVGNLYVADEGNNAISVINMGLTSRTIQGAVVPAGTIQKLAGEGTSATKTVTGECPNFVSTASRGGCYFGKWTDGAVAANSNVDAPYSVALDSNNNLYFANEFNDNIGRITTANIIANFAGIQGTVLKKLNSRGPAGSFAIGSPFGVATDPLNNLYITDASNGAIWRVDAAGQTMYPIAGSAAGTTVCATASDKLGDGCPALGGAVFGSSGTTFASTSGNGPGIYGISADANGNVFVGDTVNPVVREVASGTQFGRVGQNVFTTDTLDIHFVSGDTPAATGGYTITAGTTIFTLGTAACTTNSDNTTDCLLPVTAHPTTLGPFSGTLQVKSGTSNGGTSTFALSGTAISVAPVPATRTVVSYTAGNGGCSDASYAPGTQFTINATVVSNGSPTGTVSFFANGNLLGTSNLSPTGTASLTTTITATGTYTITATYSGDGFFTTSTGTAAPAFTIQTPTFSAAVVSDGSPNVHGGCPPGVIGTCVVNQGGTGLYSFTVSQSVYTGTISFACSGLPAKSTCIFSPASITATGCSAKNTVAVSIVTSQGTPAGQAGFTPVSTGRWPMLFSLVGVLGLAGFGMRRRGAASRLGQLAIVFAALLAASSLVACGNGTKTIAGTPLGTSTVTFTATGSTGNIVAAVPVTLTVK